MLYAYLEIIIYNIIYVGLNMIYNYHV